MKAIVPLCLALGAYLLVSGLLFGSVLMPIWLATRWSDHLGLPHWKGIAVITIAASAWLSFRAFSKHVTPKWRPSLFVALSVALPTLLIGICADVARHVSITRLSADFVEGHSFFVSLREAPREPQFFLHTAALKACVPYAWSYREMAFCRLAPNVAANVLPPGWIERCSIRHEDRPGGSRDSPACRR